jgi:outer membrane protein assembly factor BamB/DNA-directed RNA polymerase subunit RPC12/RpoP
MYDREPMRAVSMNCSHCGALLTPEPDADEATCQYCGTRSVIDRPKNKSCPKGDERRASQADAAPVVQARPAKGGAKNVAAVFFSAMLTIGFVAARTYRANHAVKQATASATLAGFSRMTWNGLGPALLADVDDDGSADAIGFVRYVLDGDQIRLAAFSGKDGKRLWETPSLGTYESVGQAPLALAGKRILLADPRGSMTAYDVASGKAAWTTALGERVDKLCTGSKDGEALVQTKDAAWQRLDLADGRANAETAKPAAKGKAAPLVCKPLPSNVHSPRSSRESGTPDVKGMRVSRVLTLGKGTRVALGQKSPGTSIPMLAGLGDKDAVRWKSDIPSGNPLEASTSEPELVTPGDDAVYVVIEDHGKHPPALVAFDGATGTRKWETFVKKGTTIVMRGLTVSSDRVFVSSWGHLQAFDRSTGEPAFVIGQP